MDIYNLKDCVTFRKTKEVYGGLSNMAAGYPLIINEIPIRTSEALYQACRFPDLPEIQKLIIEQKSPMAAKMKSKPHRTHTREDWDALKIAIMQWCLQAKLIQNWDKFSELLLSTKAKPIVELSHKDRYWGTVKASNDTIIGNNHLGKLLTELRHDIRAGKDFKKLPPLNIPDFNLYGKPITTVKPIKSPKERPTNTK